MRVSRAQLEQDLPSSTTGVETAVTLPSYCYTSIDFLTFEKEAVFARAWLCVGRQEEIPEAGDYFTVQILDEPLLVVRDRDGDVRVMSNVCRHRACLVAEGSGNGGRVFRCPYHWWVYDLDGRLIGAPEMDQTADFDMSEIRLPELAVEVWQGFIFANFENDAAPLAPQLAKLDELLVNYHVGEMVTMPPEILDRVDCNWKVMVENFIESYHSSRLHKGPHDFAPSSNAVWREDWADEEACIFGWTVTTHPDGGFNPTMKALFPPIPTLDTQERQKTMFALVPPMLMIGLAVDHLFWFIGLPQSPNAISLRMAYCFPARTLELELFDELYKMAIAGVDVFNQADLAANTSVQMGLHSKLAERGRYSHQEARLVQFNRWLVKRYLAAALTLDEANEQL